MQQVLGSLKKIMDIHMISLLDKIWI